MIRLMSKQTVHKVEEVGRFLLSREKRDQISAGEVGYIFAGVKTVQTFISEIRLPSMSDPVTDPSPDSKNSNPWFSLRSIRSLPRTMKIWRWLSKNIR